eukprot:3890472-Amphidinium_carterae.1
MRSSKGKSVVSALLNGMQGTVQHWSSPRHFWLVVYIFGILKPGSVPDAKHCLARYASGCTVRQPADSKERQVT